MDKKHCHSMRAGDLRSLFYVIISFMKNILRLYIPYIPGVLVTGSLILLQAILQLALPKYMASIIDGGIIGGNMDFIVEKGLMMVLLSVILAVCAVAVSYLASRIGARSACHIRSEVFRKVTSFGVGEAERFGTASLITRATNDIQQLHMASVMVIRMGFFAPAMGIGALVMAVRTSRELTWTIVVSIVAIFAVIAVGIILAMPKFKILQKLIDRLNLIVNERLSGILVIRAFNREKSEQERFDRANLDLTRTNLFISRLMSMMMPAMSLVMSFGSLLVVWAGAGLINAELLNVGDMMAFIQYAMHVVMACLFLTMFFIMIPRALVSLQRVSEVLAVEPAIKDKPSTELSVLPKDTPGRVEFRNVTFRYPNADENILEDISFTAEPGSVTAIVGGTGSGKSTLINLLPRLYDVTAGQILIDGVDIRDLSQHNLHELIGYVPQLGILFSGTIGSNLRYGSEDLSDEEMIRAAAIAQASGFIAAKPGGFDDAISQGGTNVSGGQKQRLSIARALARKTPIYIFDDSFSALDFQTEAALRSAFQAEAEASTVFIVAQRISTIKQARQILVMDEGRLVGIGTHQELLRGCSVYVELAASQLDPEELAGLRLKGGCQDGRS